MVAAPTPVPEPRDPKAPAGRSTWIATVLVSAGLAGASSLLYYITSRFGTLYDSLGVNVPWIVLNYRWLYPCFIAGAVPALIAKQFFVRSEGRRMAVTIGVAALFVLLFWGVILALYGPILRLGDQPH